jgi:hypothetical protein
MKKQHDYDIREALMRSPEYAEEQATKRKAAWICATIAYFALAVIEPRAAVLLAYVVGCAIMARD